MEAGLESRRIASTMLPFQPAVQQQSDWIANPALADSTFCFRSNLIVVGSGAEAHVASLTKSIHFCLIACPEPTTPKTSPAKPRDEIGALTHETPEKARSVIFDHQNDWPLVETIVEWGYPPL